MQSSKLEVTVQADQGVEKKHKLSHAASTATTTTTNVGVGSQQQTFKRVSVSSTGGESTLRKTSGILALETMTPWGVVLKPVIRGRFADQQEVEKSDTIMFEKSQLKSIEPSKITFKKISRKETQIVEKQAELKPVEKQPEPKTVKKHTEPETTETHTEPKAVKKQSKEPDMPRIGIESKVCTKCIKFLVCYFLKYF